MLLISNEFILKSLANLQSINIALNTEKVDTSEIDLNWMVDYPLGARAIS